jgi:hypothetical protein
MSVPHVFDLSSRPTASAVAEAAPEVFRRVWRPGFDEPGFALVDFGPAVGSRAFRGLMMDLRDRLSGLFAERSGRCLAVVTAGRYDQQASTRFHLDGAPDESLLMLGYQPTPVASRLSAADYSRCARDLGIGPKRFLLDHNPMFPAGEAKLAGYVSEISAFDHRRYQAVLFNNSRLDPAPAGSGALGVMHRAVIPVPDPSAMRVIDSLLLAVAEPGTPDAVGAEQLREFAEGDGVIRR